MRGTAIMLSAMVFVIAASRAEAQVAGTTFSLFVISPLRGVAQGSLAFDNSGGFAFTASGGGASVGTYTETVDATTNESSLTLTAGLSQPVTGISLAQTLNRTINGNRPVTLIYGVSYGGRNRFIVFVGYVFPPG